MDLFFEALFIGLFSLGIFSILQFFTLLDWKISFFTTGVLKHFLGYWLGIQDAYCRFYTGVSHVPPPSSMELILEGFAYCLIGGWFRLVIKNPWILLFCIGFALHLLVEWSGIHDWFLRRCS